MYNEIENDLFSIIQARVGHDIFEAWGISNKIRTRNLYN